MMTFYTTTLVPILGVMVAVSMTAFLAHCYNQWANRYYTMFRKKRI